MSVRVITPGMLTTVQDLGRWGFQSSGVPVAGPMDAYAHRLANAMVGNAVEEATLEVTLVGPELEFEDEAVVAVTGAEFEVTVDDRAVPMYSAVQVGPGSRLKLGTRQRGARAYIGVSGGIDVPRVFGSRATHLTSGMGGLNGRALRSGDRLAIGKVHGPATCPEGRRGEAGHDVHAQDGVARVRILPGPQTDRFAATALETLQAAPYTISPQSDRMGFRLEGARLVHARGADMISDATPMGVLQVPASGQPILLMADRQTAGGYPAIATVITADLPVAGQLLPGDPISFVVCSPAEAMKALIARERQLLTLERSEPA